MIAAPALPGWAQRMTTAWFKDDKLSFLTESHDTKGGRRLAIHEFPGAEEPVVEDLGGKADEFHLNAYFIGPDYDLFRDKFLLALNTPGADWLMHPWRGLLWVRAHNWSVHESNDKGCYCAISVDFAPGGMVQTMLVDRTDLAVVKIKEVANKATNDFAPKPMNASAFATFLAAVSAQLDKLRDVLAMAQLPLTMLHQVMGVIQGIKGDLAALMALPGAYAAALNSLADMLGLGLDSASTDVADVARPRLVAALTKQAASALPVAGSPDYSPALLVNLASEAALRSRLLVVAAMQVALADYREAGVRDAALANVVTAIDTLLPAMSDPVFQAAVSARTALIDALLAQHLVPSNFRDIVNATPATVLAHRMGIDEAVFLAQNKPRHPLFVRGRVYD
jgi:prophage DNA circulation protein